MSAFDAYYANTTTAPYYGDAQQQQYYNYYGAQGNAMPAVAGAPVSAAADVGAPEPRGVDTSEVSRASAGEGYMIPSPPLQVSPLGWGRIVIGLDSLAVNLYAT
jgi:hypothetical protein